MYKYQENSLFRPDHNNDLNAAVGKNGGPYDYSALGEGFFEAGFNLVEAIKEGKWTIDILVYPTVFNFRHGIELYMKHFIIVCEKLNPTAATIKKNHSLLDNWTKTADAIRGLNHPYFKETDIQAVELIIKDFACIDPDNQVFRYPEDKTGKPFIDEFSMINIGVLENGMRVVFDVFEAWESGIVALCEDRLLDYHSIAS